MTDMFKMLKQNGWRSERSRVITNTTFKLKILKKVKIIIPADN